MEAEVRHHRDDNRPTREEAPARQVGCEEGEQAVTVDDVAAGIDRDHPVGVAVEREPEVSSLRDNGPGQLSRVGGTAVLIDVRAVRVGAEDRHKLGARSFEHRRRTCERSPVRAVERHPQPL